MVLARPGAVRAAPRFLVLAGAFWASLAAAQADPDEPKVDPKFESHAEKARREGEKVFKWIRLHSNPPERPAPPPAAGAVAPAPKAPAQPAGSERPKAPAAPAPRAPAPVAVPSVSTPPPAAVPSGPALPRAASPASPSARAPMPAAAASLPAAPAGAVLAAPVPGPEGGRVEPFNAESTPRAAGDGGAAASASSQAGAAGLGTSVPDEEDSALVLVASVEPEFPAALMRRLRKGWVQVRVVVNPDGSVAEAEVAGSSHPRLNEPALAAVRRWAFKPPGQTREATAELEFDLDGR